MFNRTVLGAIWLYQSYLSPRKGFRCAYSVVHGGTGCSGYVKHTIRAEGLWRGWPKIRARFADCQAAYAAVLSDTSPEDDAEANHRRRRQNRRDLRTDCCFYSCVGSTLPCTGAAREARDTGSNCDLNACDGDCGLGTCSCDINPCG